MHSAWLKGYNLYSLGNYPFAVKSSDATNKILVEVTQILDTETEKTITDMETQAGYYAEKIEVGDHLVTIFLFEEHIDNLRIDSGDWVSFFGQ